MPRTKQTKPRHIVESDKTNEGQPSPYSMQESPMIEDDDIESFHGEKSPSECITYNENSPGAGYDELEAKSVLKMNDTESIQGQDDAPVDDVWLISKQPQSENNDKVPEEAGAVVDLMETRSISPLGKCDKKRFEVSPVSKGWNENQTFDDRNPVDYVNASRADDHINHNMQGDVAFHSLNNGFHYSPGKQLPSFNAFGNPTANENKSNEIGRSNGLRAHAPDHGNSYKQFPDQFNPEPFQYQNISAAASQYLHTLKALMGGRDLKKQDQGLDFWKAWANAARIGSQQSLDSTENSSLFNRYLTQLTERWNSIMMQQFSKSGHTRFHPYSEKSESADVKLKSLHEDKLRPASVDKDDQNSSEETSRSVEPIVMSPLLSDVSPDQKSSGNLSGEDLPPTTSISPNIRPTGKTDDFKRDRSPYRREAIPGPVNLPRRAPSPLDIPKNTNHHLFQPNSPMSAPAYENDRFAHLRGPLNPFTSYRPWSASDWLGYQSSKLPNFSDRFHYPHIPNENGVPFTFAPMLPDKLPLVHPLLKSTNDENRKVSLSREKTAEILHTNIPATSVYATKSQPSSPDIATPHRKFSESNPVVKKNDYQSGRFLDEIRRHYSMPHPPFSWPGLGTGLAGNPITSPTFTGMQSPLTPNSGSKSQLFFPPRMPMLSTSGYPMANSVSPREGCGYSPNLSYKSETSVPLSPSASKLNGARRSRARGPPIDSVHAAIVREAKEQFKGLDPENMYIQCPICQKRIKRLYHFQRHMRIHTGEKTHQCPCCQYKSVRKDNLKSHMKTHEKQTLENGRKSVKSAYHSSRNSEPLNGKIYSRSSNQATSGNLPAIKCKSSDTTGSTSAANDLKQSPTDLNDHHSCNPIWKGFPDYKRQISYPNSYSIPYYVPPFQAGVADQPTIKNENHDKKEEVMNLQNGLRKSLYEPTMRQDLKPENGGHSPELRDKFSRLADSGLSPRRPSPGRFVDVDDKASGAMKRSYAAQHLADLLCQRREEEGPIKRQKPMNSEFKVEKFSPQSQTTERNVNNNNDTSVTEGPIEKTVLPAFPYFTKSPTSLSHLGQGENIVNNKYSEAAKVRNDHLRENRFGSGASATLVGLAAAAAAANKRCHQDANLVPLSGPLNASPARNQSYVADDISMPDGNSTSGELNPKEHRIELDGSKSRNSAASPRPSTTLRTPVSRDDVYDDVKISGKTFDAKGVDAAPKTSDEKKTAITVKNELSSCDPISDVAKHVQEIDNNNDARHQNNDGPPNVLTPFPRDNDKRAEESNPASKGLTCRLCSFSSSSGVELQSHMSNMHKQDGFYKCEECNYLGKNLSKLVEHIRIHTGERPFKCDQCNYAAKRKDNLAQHKAVRHDKRKTKSNSLYTVLDQINRDSATTRKYSLGANSHLVDKKRESNEKKAQVRASEHFPLFPNLRYAPKMDVGSDFSYGRDYDKDQSPTATAPLTPPFHLFPAMHTLPPSMFQYPFYPPPPMIHHSDLAASIAGNPAKTVSSPGTYSVKVRAALITP